MYLEHRLSALLQIHLHSWLNTLLQYTMAGRIHKIISSSLKRKCRHFDEILITGCTGSCHFDNFQCNQWWKFHQNEDISVSVFIMFMPANRSAVPVITRENFLCWRILIYIYVYSKPAIVITRTACSSNIKTTTLQSHNTTCDKSTLW